MKEKICVIYNYKKFNFVKFQNLATITRKVIKFPFKFKRSINVPSQLKQKITIIGNNVISSKSVKTSKILLKGTVYTCK